MRTIHTCQTTSRGVVWQVFVLYHVLHTWLLTFNHLVVITNTHYIYYVLYVAYAMHVYFFIYHGFYPWLFTFNPFGILITKKQHYECLHADMPVVSQFQRWARQIWILYLYFEPYPYSDTYF